MACIVSPNRQRSCSTHAVMASSLDMSGRSAFKTARKSSVGKDARSAVTVSRRPFLPRGLGAREEVTTYARRE
jgi:hypothetical protein